MLERSGAVARQSRRSRRTSQGKQPVLYCKAVAQLGFGFVVALDLQVLLLGILKVAPVHVKVSSSLFLSLKNVLSQWACWTKGPFALGYDSELQFTSTLPLG